MFSSIGNVWCRNKCRNRVNSTQLEMSAAYVLMHICIYIYIYIYIYTYIYIDIHCIRAMLHLSHVFHVLKMLEFNQDVQFIMSMPKSSNLIHLDWSHWICMIYLELMQGVQIIWSLVNLFNLLSSFNWFTLLSSFKLLNVYNYCIHVECSSFGYEQFCGFVQLTRFILKLFNVFNLNCTY